jgi:hypothetical protein
VTQKTTLLVPKPLSLEWTPFVAAIDFRYRTLNFSVRSRATLDHTASTTPILRPRGRVARARVQSGARYFWLRS